MCVFRLPVTPKSLPSGFLSGVFFPLNSSALHASTGAYGLPQLLSYLPVALAVKVALCHARLLTPAFLQVRCWVDGG